MCSIGAKTVPAKKIDPDRLVRILRKTEKPVMDVSAMADAIGASEQGVRNYVEELEEREDVGSMQIGPTTCYWYTGDGPLTGQEMVEAIDEYETPLEEIKPVPVPEGDRTLGDIQRKLKGKEPTAATDGGYTPVEQTFTSLTVNGAVVGIVGLLLYLSHLVFGTPWPNVAFILTLFILAVTVASYAILTAERELRSNRATAALSHALRGIWRGAP